MKIGTITIPDKSLLLAPMESVTDQSFRMLCKEFGADMMYTEFVSSDALIRNINSSINKLNVSPEERPIGAQIYGNDPITMAEATKVALLSKPDLIDINFGCPVKKIAGRGAGSGMMKNVPLMVEITKEIVKASNIPVTVKTRLGWDDNSKNIEEIALRLQDEGIAALTIHGRTREQMYKGEADWTLIGQVKNNPAINIPIIGNGDVNSPQMATEYFDRYGVDAIMIGRATYGYPWIFSDVKHYMKHGEIAPQKTVVERVNIARRHLDLSVMHKNEKVGVLEMRRHMSCYFKGLPDFKPMRIRLVTEPTQEGVHQILNEIEQTWGDFDYGDARPHTLYGL